MLDLERVDLPSLASALEDHSDETTWWFDPRTGESEPWSEELREEDEEDPEGRGLIPVEPLDPGTGYRDMEEFIDRVRDPRARDLLERAIQGRGAFRRFKDTLFEFPDLREAWFRFHDARMERRALEWLAEHALLDGAAARREIANRPDPDLAALSGVIDAAEIARAEAVDLRNLYGQRLRRVVLFGSWARGDANPESDIDLLVVLDRVDSFWKERKRMERILWRYSFANDTVVSAIAVGEIELSEPTWPALIRATAEGRVVG